MVKRTAQVVGLNMPPPLEDKETKEGGGLKWSELPESGRPAGRRERNWIPVEDESSVGHAAAIVENAMKTMTKD